MEDDVGVAFLRLSRYGVGMIPFWIRISVPDIKVSLDGKACIIHYAEYWMEWMIAYADFPLIIAFSNG